MKKCLLITILVGCAVADALAQRSVEPMVSASWHQTAPFNGMCPGGAVAGCGAVAVAQILNYYKMPAHGFGHVAYENVDIDYDDWSIDWPNILDSYAKNAYDKTEGDAVAR